MFIWIFISHMTSIFAVHAVYLTVILIWWFGDSSSVRQI